MFTGKHLKFLLLPGLIAIPGVVVENFSYVFQASGRGAKSISRKQMRAFKKLWAEYANSKGYLERHHFTSFFSVSAALSYIPSHLNQFTATQRCIRSQDLSVRV